jgi:hypothetical protein
MMSNHRTRLAREQRTVEAMIAIYCRERHAAGPGLCVECEALADYARLRLQKCPFGHDKPTCANCSIHCYRPGMRARIKAVMRVAGPRMLYRHPILAVLHLVDGLRRTPERPRRKEASPGNL